MLFSRVRYSGSFALSALLIASLATPALAINPPKVKVRAARNGESIEIRATFKDKFKKSALQVDFQRARDNANEGSFATLSSVNTRKKTQRKIVDSPSESGTYFYRSRLVTKRGVSKWSSPVAVSIVADDDSNGDDGGGGSINPPPPPASTPTACNATLPANVRECPAGHQDQVYALVNAARASAGVGPLARNDLLNCSSRNHTLWLATTNPPPANTHDGFSTRIRDAGYQYRMAGQNVAWSYNTPQSVVTAWLNSPGHRANLIDRPYQDIGISCLIDANGKYWWTQDFGAR